jgi:hypothetical protein
MGASPVKCRPRTVQILTALRGGGNSTSRRGRHGRDGPIGRRQPATLPHLHRSALASHPVP